MAEGVGFEPTVQLPVHGISSAAPSATRPPLRTARRPSKARKVKIWRRGEDLNPRGTHAPIRFRVGRLQPGSATPPHVKSITCNTHPTDTRSCHQAGLVSGYFHSTTPRPHESLHRLPEKFRGEVTVAGDHAEGPPASKLLDSPEVDSGHDQPGREGVPIRVPSIPREAMRIPPCIHFPMGARAFSPTLRRPSGDNARAGVVDRARTKPSPS